MRAKFWPVQAKGGNDGVENNSIVCIRRIDGSIKRATTRSGVREHFRTLWRDALASQYTHSRMDLRRSMRFQALDGWRGVCAVALALFHLNVYSHIHDRSLIRHAYLFVDFFFVLSGFVIGSAYFRSLNSDGGVWTFMIRRFGRLWPLHISILTAFILLEIMKSVAMTMGANAAEDSFSDKTSFFAIFTNIFMIHSLGLHSTLTWNIPSWSISTEFYTYAFFAAMLAVFRRRQVALIATFIASTIFSMSVVAYVSQHGQDTTYAYGFFRCLSGFLSGVLVFHIHSHITSRATCFGTLWEFVTLAMAILYLCFFGTLEYSFAAPLVFSAVVLVYAKQEGWLSSLMCLPVFKKIGDWSYSIYMVHYLVAISVINRPIDIIEKATGWPLTANLGAMNAATFGSEAGKIIVLGGKYQADLLTLAYVFVVIFVARQTYVFIELPCRNYFNGLASPAVHSSSQQSRRAQFASNADHTSFPTGRPEDAHTQATP
jgi:peptidoglycan/LPS O-acetylase OafA/YrhL